MRRFRVVALRVRHYDMAEELVDLYGPTQGLRALDSLHLASALDLKSAEFIETLVSADKVLARVAVLKGLSAIDPEI